MARRGRTAPLDRFGERGERLWKAHHDQIDGERGLVLLEEACRIADRLDGLDRVLRGVDHEFLRIINEDVGEYRFYVDAALSESRQQASTLRQILAALPLKEADDGDDGAAWLDDDVSG